MEKGLSIAPCGRECLCEDCRIKPLVDAHIDGKSHAGRKEVVTILLNKLTGIQTPLDRLTVPFSSRDHILKSNTELAAHCPLMAQEQKEMLTQVQAAFNKRNDQMQQNS